MWNFNLVVSTEVLAKVNLSLEQILKDEVAGMAFPVDARFFDSYPLVFGKEEDAAGRQYPQWTLWMPRKNERASEY